MQEMYLKTPIGKAMIHVVVDQGQRRAGYIGFVLVGLQYADH